MLKRILLAVVVAGFCSTGAFAQEVFLSFGQGANVSDTATVSPTDTTGTLFLFSRDLSFQSFNVDVLSSDTSVADFTSATIFNPEFRFSIFGQPPITNRFTNVNDGAAPGDDIAVVRTTDEDTGELNALSLVGVGSFNGDLGVDNLASSVDSTFDADANAFLIAEINYDITGIGTTEFTLGTTDISFLVSTFPAEEFASPALGSATLTVPAAIPEPSTVGLLALGLVGFVARRRR